MLSRNLMIELFAYFLVPLKAMCSTMCARPRSPSSSRMDLSCKITLSVVQYSLNSDSLVLKWNSCKLEVPVALWCLIAAWRVDAFPLSLLAHNHCKCQVHVWLDIKKWRLVSTSRIGTDTPCFFLLNMIPNVIGYPIPQCVVIESARVRLNPRP